MATTTFGLWMNQDTGSATTTVPPLARDGSFSSSSTSAATMIRKANTSHIRSEKSPSKSINPDAAGFSLQLTRVLGTTTSSVSGFAYRDSCFATVAGSTAVVHHIDDDFNVTQRFFRARPSATPAVQAIASPVEGPITPEQPRFRNVASVRASMFGTRAPNSPVGNEFGLSPAKVVARQRTRTAACVALSPDGKLVAVGENGYAPRILVFSMASNGYEAPVSTLTEHSGGVKCVAFSPDSKWMCSVGDVYDGYICLWSINQRNGTPRLHSINKCTSTINDLTFMSNNTIISVGTRHVRIWRNDERKPPSPTKFKLRLDISSPSTPSSPGSAKAFSGRNCLLGSLLEAKSFTCVAACSATKAFACSDRGDLCLIDDSDNQQKLICVRKLGFTIRCISIDRKNDRLWLGGDTSHLISIPLKEAMNTSRPISPVKEPVNGFEATPLPKTLAAGALGFVHGRLVLIDSERSVKFLQPTAASTVDFSNIQQTAASHASPVLGIDVTYDDRRLVNGFMTWEASGAVLFWNKQYEHVRSCSVSLDSLPTTENEEANELRRVLALRDGERYLSGDKRGNLRVFRNNDWTQLQAVKSHSAEITDIAFAESDDAEMIITSGRDRMIQVFELENNELILIQTIESHGSSVNELLVVEKGRFLLSASSDRTVMISALASTPESRAYVPVRMVTLKSTPASIALSSEDSNDVVVTTIDKQLIRFSILEGPINFKTNGSEPVRLTDTEESETVLLTSAATRTVRAGTGPSQLLIGVSSTDKSLRVHNAYTGTTLLKDFGHSEGISSMLVLEESHEGGNSWYSIVSTGVDGTIMRWELSNSAANAANLSAICSVPDSPATEAPPLAQPPLRRVLSRSALAEHSKILEADGTFPVPSIPSSRNPSPNRLRRKFSNFSVGTGSTGRARSARPSILPPMPSMPNRSPSPTSPVDNTPTQPARTVRPGLPERSKTKSTNALNDNLHQSTDQINKQLRLYRKKLNSTSSLLKTETALELEKELIATVNLLTQRSRRQRTASGNNVGDLLDQYSEKVARLVQNSKAQRDAAPERSSTLASGGSLGRVKRERQTLGPIGRDNASESP